ncbi:MAG: hypothetical protein Kilf2KO_16810 [Rhodospirillales bacterium]
MTVSPHSYVVVGRIHGPFNAVWEGISYPHVLVWFAGARRRDGASVFAALTLAGHGLQGQRAYVTNPSAVWLALTQCSKGAASRQSDEVNPLNRWPGRAGGSTVQ